MIGGFFVTLGKICMIGVMCPSAFLFTVVKMMTPLEIGKTYYNPRALLYHLQHTVIIHKCYSFCLA